MDNTEFKPFQNDSQSLTIGESLTFENGTESINIYGDITINKNSADDVEILNEIINNLTNIKNNIKIQKDKNLKR